MGGYSGVWNCGGEVVRTWLGMVFELVLGNWPVESGFMGFKGHEAWFDLNVVCSVW